MKKLKRFRLVNANGDLDTTKSISRTLTLPL